MSGLLGFKAAVNIDPDAKDGRAGSEGQLDRDTEAVGEGGDAGL